MGIKYRKPNGGLIGIDIGSTSIKKLELSKQGDTYQVDDFAVYPLPEGAVVDKNVVKIEVVAQALEKLMKTSKSNATGIAFAISASNIVQRWEKMDASQTDQEIHSHVNAQLDKFIPFPVSEVSMDYAIHAEKYNGRDIKHVQIVAAKNDAIQPKLELFELAGIKANVATVESLAVEKLVPLIVQPSEKVNLLFDFGFSNTIIYAIKNNKIIYTRDHEFGGTRLTQMIGQYYGCKDDEAESLRDEKINEQDADFIDYILKPFLAEAAQQFNQAVQLCLTSTDTTEVDQVLLSGGPSKLYGLTEALQDELGYPVKLACPFDKMRLSPRINDREFNKERSSLLTVCGLALCDVGDSINLLPWREELNQAKKRKFLTGLAAAGVIGVAVSVSGWGLAKAGFNSQSSASTMVTSQISAIDGQLAELQQVTTLRDQMLERMKLIQGLQAQRPVIVEMTNSLVKSLPEDAYLTSMSKDGTSFSFVGKAKDVEVVAAFMRNLKESGWFSDVFMSNFDSYKPDANGKGVKITSEEGRYGAFIVTANLSDFAVNTQSGVNASVPPAPAVEPQPVAVDPVENAGDMEVGEAPPPPVETAPAQPVPAPPVVPLQMENNEVQGFDPTHDVNGGM